MPILELNSFVTNHFFIFERSAANKNGKIVVTSA